MHRTMEVGRGSLTPYADDDETAEPLGGTAARFPRPPSGRPAGNG